MDVSATLAIIAALETQQEQEEKKKELAAYLNQLLTTDFPALVQMLYRVDVPEQKLKAVLQQNPAADAGDLLAELMLERHKEKLAARQDFSSAELPPEEEAW
jgi:hypothetical protein